LLAITKASLKGIFRSPSAVIFSFLFPLIFILTFGFIGESGGVPVARVAIAKDCDTNNELYDSIVSINRFKVVKYANDSDLKRDLDKGKIAGVIKILKTGIDTPAYNYTIESTNTNVDEWAQVLPLLNTISNQISNKKYNNRPNYAVSDFNYKRDIKEIREYKRIDFILPGQLGFSLLSAGVFGVAFMFFNLRSTLVLKRFFATPISRTNIILGEALSRVLFQLLTAIVILVIGHFCFGFTLVNGVVTFFELLVLSFIALLVFMGFGFIVSGLAKTESTIPPFANLITLPQFLLSGTFFSIDNFPNWLQPICKILPLTHLNDAMRKVAFEGAHLTDCGPQIGILAIWGVVAYAVAVKTFRWE
jgi:ABC-2 type transport system permease protein